MAAGASPHSDFGMALHAARGGSRSALGAMLDRYRNSLLDVANDELPADLRAKVGASDLVQETFLEAQRDFSDFAGADAADFAGWLHGILRHNLLDLVKRYRAADRRAVAKEIPLHQENLDDKAFAQDTPSPYSSGTRTALHGALGQLRENHQEVIRLRNYERLTFEQIGQRLDRSSDAARKLWVRAVEELRALLQPAVGPS